MAVCRQTGAATAGTASSATSASFSRDASTGPATCPGSATARGTGGACCAIKVGVVVGDRWHRKRQRQEQETVHHGN